MESIIIPLVIGAITAMIGFVSSSNTNDTNVQLTRETNQLNQQINKENNDTFHNYATFSKLEGLETAFLTLDFTSSRASNKSPRSTPRR